MLGRGIVKDLEHLYPSAATTTPDAPCLYARTPPSSGDRSTAS